MFSLVSYTVRNFSTHWRTVSVLDKVWALHFTKFFSISVWPSTIMPTIFLRHFTACFLSVYTVPSAQVMEILAKSSAWKERVTPSHFISCYPLTISTDSILERSFKSYFKRRDSSGNRLLWQADLKFPTSPSTEPEFYYSLHNAPSDNNTLRTLFPLGTKTHSFHFVLTFYSQLRPSHQIICQIKFFWSSHLLMYCVPCPSHTHSFAHPNNIWGRLKIMKLVIV